MKFLKSCGTVIVKVIHTFHAHSYSDSSPANMSLHIWVIFPVSDLFCFLASSSLSSYYSNFSFLHIPFLHPMDLYQFACP